MINSIKDGYNLLFWIFIIMCVYGGTNSKELESNYTVNDVNSRSELTTESNNNIEQIRTESNTEWGDISNPSY